MDEHLAVLFRLLREFCYVSELYDRNAIAITCRGFYEYGWPAPSRYFIDAVRAVLDTRTVCASCGAHGPVYGRNTEFTRALCLDCSQAAEYAAYSEEFAEF